LEKLAKHISATARNMIFFLMSLII
jgi:hypothetical protein